MRRRHTKKGSYYYVEVTNDVYELPINVTESAKEMAVITGVAAEAIYMQALRREKGECNKTRFVKVRKK